MSSVASAATALYTIASYDTGYGSKVMYKAYISLTLQSTRDPKATKNVFVSFYDASKRLPEDKKDTAHCSEGLDCYNVSYHLSDYENFLKSLASEHKFVQFDDASFELTVRTSSQPANF